MENHPLPDRESTLVLSHDERIDTVNENVRLIQSKNGLTFGTDAFLLAAFIRAVPHHTAADLGSGTGIIPLLLLARDKVQTVKAIELQSRFADLIARNAELNGVGTRLLPLCADVRTLSANDIGGEVSLVFSNPPYMTCGSGARNEQDEKYMARHEVCGGIADFCDCAYRLLKHGGRFVCVWRPDRLTDLFAALRDARLEPKRMVFVHADEHAEPSMVLIESVKGGAVGLRTLPPLFLYQPHQADAKQRVLTPRAQKIYDTCVFGD